MSLLALVSSQRLTVSQSAFINEITASTLNVSSIGGGNLIGERNITSTVQGLGSIGYVSTPSLFSSIIGLGSANYISTASLVSTTLALQTAGFLSSPTLASTVAGLGSASYISSPQLLSTSAGIASLLGSGLVTSNLTSTVAGIGINFAISSFSNSTINRVLIQPGPDLLVLTNGSPNSGTTCIKISRNNGTSWLNTTSGDFSSAAYGIAYNGVMWVCCGTGGGTIKYSYDAFNWSNVISGAFTGSGFNVAWNGKMWLALGSGDTTIKYSYDGLIWSNAASGVFTNNGYSAAWNGNMWVAVGSDSTPANTVKYSGDGINWSNRASGTAIYFSYGQYNNVTFGKRTWVICGTTALANGSNAMLQYSGDGINWSNSTGSTFNYNLFSQYAGYSVAYNGSLFVASGIDSNNSANYSYDGITWFKSVTGPGSSGIVSLVWSGKYFFGSLSLSPNSLTQSLDGINWAYFGAPSNNSSGGAGASSNAMLPYDQGSLQITNNFIYNTYGSWNSTCLIQPQWGSLNINDTLEVDRALNRIGVNCNYPRYTVDVNGILNTNTLLINTANFTQIISSTATALSNSLGPAFPSTVSTTYGQTFRTSNLIPSTISLVNIPPSSSNLWVAVGLDATANNRIKYSFDGSNWLNSTGASFSVRANGVAYNGSLWVAVGQDATANNTIKYSGNGITWSNANSGGFTTAGNDVAWNGRIWVAVGVDSTTNNMIKYSGDGSNWSNSGGTSFDGGGSGVAWNGYMWVAVGSDSTGSNASIKYSYNGINWSNIAIGGFSSNLGRGVAWGGRMWVAAGSDITPNNRLKYSYDGISWFNSIGQSFNTPQSVAWNGQFWLAVGSDDASRYIKYSLDGISWLNTEAQGESGVGVAWNGSYWVAVNSSSTSNNRIQYSFNGINWSNSLSGAFQSSGENVAFSSNTLPTYQQTNLSILPQNIPLFLTSTNTIFAQPSSLIINNTLEVDAIVNRVGINCNAPRNTLDVAGTASLSSINFLNLAPQTSNLWVAAGYDSTSNGNLKYSGNGINWSNTTGAGFATYGAGVAWNGQLWVAVGSDSGNGTIKYSGNGINWSNCAGGGFTSFGFGVAWNGRVWVVVGSGGANGGIKYSGDGINWSNVTSGGFSTGYGIAWNGQMWVGVGDDGSSSNIKYSYDGLNWSNASGATFSGGVGFGGGGRGVAWNGRMWVAAGYGATTNATIKYSFDGINWSDSAGLGFTTSEGGRAVSWNGQYWLALGYDTPSNATIKYSYNGINWSNITSGGFTSYARGAAWNGNMWVAIAQDSTTNNTIKYSYDGLNWSNSAGTGFNSSGNGIAFSSNVIPTYNQNNLSILPQNIPLFLTSTNTIGPLQSSIIINDTLIVDKQWDRVGINCNVPQNTLDVAGQTFTSSIQTNIVSTLRVQASTIAVLNVPTLIFWADATKATTNNSFTVVSSMSNVFLGSNLIQSNGSADAGIILPYTGSYMFEVTGWRCGTGSGTTGVLVTRGGSQIYGRVRTVAYADCSLFTGQFFWNLFQAGDKASFYKNENNGSLVPNGATATNQNLPFSTASDDQQGPIKVWYYGGSGNI